MFPDSVRTNEALKNVMSGMEFVLPPCMLNVESH